MKEISWELQSNKETIIKKKTLGNITSLEINFADEDGQHEIDLEKYLYKRIAKDYTMIIDFKKRISTFNFNTGESCQIDIECNFLNNTKEIILEYKFDDLKTLIIQKE